MTRKPEYDRGHDDALRWAVTWLHNRAKGMNDPHAQRVLDSAAYHLGLKLKAKVAERNGKAPSVSEDDSL